MELVWLANHICKQCAKVFTGRKTAKYCSLMCYFSASGKRYPVPNTKFVCQYCGKDFELADAPSKLRTRKYCSVSCAIQSQRAKLINVGKSAIQRNCKACGRLFLITLSRMQRGQGHYCSYSCNVKRKRKVNLVIQACNCSMCGKEILRYPSQMKQRKQLFCSLACARKAEWRGGPKASYARRRMTVKNEPGDFIDADWSEILQEFNYRCAYCLKLLSRPTQDHITPLSRGGTHTRANVIPSCQSCNSKKGQKSLLDFVVSGGYASVL